MLVNGFDLEKLKKYTNSDLEFIKEIERQIKENEQYFESFTDLEKIYTYIEILYKLNYIVVEYESNEYLDNLSNIVDIYIQAKQDLGKVLDFIDIFDFNIYE